MYGIHIQSYFVLQNCSCWQLSAILIYAAISAFFLSFSKKTNDFDTIQQGSKLKLRGIKNLLEKRTIEIPVEVEGNTIITILDISDRQYNYLIAGGALNFVKEELQG